MALRTVHLKQPQFLIYSLKRFFQSKKNNQSLLTSESSWPDIQLGPLAIAHPQFPLPHNVGIPAVMNHFSRDLDAEDIVNIVLDALRVSSTRPIGGADLMVNKVDSKIALSEKKPLTIEVDVQMKPAEQTFRQARVWRRRLRHHAAALITSTTHHNAQQPRSILSALPITRAQSQLNAFRDLMIGLNHGTYYDTIPYPLYNVSPLHFTDGYECIVQQCPLILRNEVIKLFRMENYTSDRPLTAVTLRFFFVKNAPLQFYHDKFVDTAFRLCAEIHSHGHWADFVHPNWKKTFVGGLSVNPQKHSLILQDFQKTCIVNEASNGHCDVIEHETESSLFGFVGHVFCDLSETSNIWSHDFMLPHNNSILASVGGARVVSSVMYSDDYSDYDSMSDEDW